MMANKARRPQAPKQRNWVAKAVRALDGPYRPKQFKDKTKNKRPKHNKIEWDE